MSEIVKLPSGNTATLCDPKTVKHKTRVKALTTINDDRNQYTAIEGLQSAIISMLVTEWSFDFPIPSILISTLGELDLGDYDTLAIKANEAAKVLNISFSNTPENEANPDSPLEKSSD